MKLKDATALGKISALTIGTLILTTMVAAAIGILMANLFGIIAIGSVAGVGGGATFAALIVLSAMDLPVALAGLLISIEPLIDMGRTALNVSGSITAGTVTSRLLGMSDLNGFDSDADQNVDKEEQGV